MTKRRFKRLPDHVGVIPDGNRRWAVERGLPKRAGYEHGLEPGMKLFDMCVDLGIKELTFYGFTHDNTKRPQDQRRAFTKACVQAVRNLARRGDAALLVIGNHTSPAFPKELLPFTTRRAIGQPRIKLNFLVNYDWQWDLFQSTKAEEVVVGGNSRSFRSNIGSSDVSRVDLIVRWGGRRRLSGFLPVQAVYADFYVIDDYWPDFRPEHFLAALEWYEKQDVTLGG